MSIEIFIAKLTFIQSVKARIAAVPVNLITGRPYGWFRDRLFLFFGINRSSPWKMMLGDTLAFVLFQVPLYVIVLLAAGATRADSTFIRLHVIDIFPGGKTTECFSISAGALCLVFPGEIKQSRCSAG